MIVMVTVMVEGRNDSDGDGDWRRLADGGAGGVGGCWGGRHETARRIQVIN